MLIGLSGYAQSGKDSLGSYLVKDFGFTRYAFADALKECVYRLNPVIVATVGVDSPEACNLELHLPRLQEVVDEKGWEEAKKHPEVRRLLQVMGTEAGRQVLGDSIWVDTVLNQVGDRDVVITDCRFPNEAEAVKSRGGYVVRVSRAGVTAVNAHPSETALDEWDFDTVVVNDGPLEDLPLIAEWLYESLETSRYELTLF